MFYLLANVNASLENIEESNNYQLKALDIAIQQNDSMYIGISYNNLADSYTNEENYSKALEYLEMAEKIQKEINDAKSRPISGNETTFNVNLKISDLHPYNLIWHKYLAYSRFGESGTDGEHKEIRSQKWTTSTER
mgnify:CR=1 FL=1